MSNWEDKSMMGFPSLPLRSPCPGVSSGALRGIYPDASSGTPHSQTVAEFIPQLCAGGFPLQSLTRKALHKSPPIPNPICAQAEIG